jgi:pSer/pThr/pTyr-binding forkhead associated (FHA) protein
MGTKEKSMAILVLLHEGLTIKKIPIEKPEMTIGRLADNDIFLDDNMVSGSHAKIEMLESAQNKGVFDYYIQDLGSTNHTIVNNESITRKQLEHNDKIRIGRHLFKFIDEATALGDKTAKLHKSWIPGVYYTKE